MDYTLELLKYLGKFHPLVLHLPIGSLLMTFLLLLVSKYQKVSLKRAIRIGVDFSFVGALIASLMGYLLSLDEAYDYNTLKFHFWAGIVTLLLSFSLCFLQSPRCNSTSSIILRFRMVLQWCRMMTALIILRNVIILPS